MDEATFYAEIERLDREFAAVPLELRQLDIYHSLVGIEDRNQSALDALTKISAWFQQKYGARAAWDGVIGRQPIMIRGSLHVFPIRHPAVTPKDGAHELREQLETADPHLSPEEHKYLSIADLESSSDFSALHNMEMRPSLFTVEQRGLARRAWFDLKNAVALLEASGDIQGSIVAAHEAAEKFLKIALIHEGLQYSKLGRGDLKHNLNSIIKALSAKHSKYKFLKGPACELESLFGSMTTQRYESVRRSISDSIEAFRLARHCCGFIAMQVELDDQRGAPDIVFKIGHYYQDYAGRQYRFCGIGKGPQGELLSQMYLLEATGNGQTIDALVTFKGPCSFHYKEITEHAVISRLERRYTEIRRRSRLEPAPKSNGVIIEQIHEAFDAVLSVKIPVRRSET